ncbi:MAG: Type secretion system protein [Verrucomicrobiota bacterium]|jgi:hypothetical protein
MKILPLLWLATAAAFAAVPFSADLEQRARAGDPAAQTDLAIAYEQGNGVPKDERKAMEWFQKARASGYPDQEIREMNRQRVAMASSEIEKAIRQYQQKNNGQLPTSLAALSSSGILSEPPRDPWAREFAYTVTPNGKSFSLFSIGPDGTPNTPDDLASLSGAEASGLDVETAAGSELPWWQAWLAKFWTWITSFWRK